MTESVLDVPGGIKGVSVSRLMQLRDSLVLRMTLRGDDAETPMECLEVVAMVNMIERLETELDELRCAPGKLRESIRDPKCSRQKLVNTLYHQETVAQGYVADIKVLRHDNGMLREDLSRAKARADEREAARAEADRIACAAFARNARDAAEIKTLRAAAASVVEAFTTHGVDATDETAQLRAALVELQIVTGMIPEDNHGRK